MKLTKKYIGNKAIWVDENLLPVVRRNRYITAAVLLFFIAAFLVGKPIEPNYHLIHYVWHQTDVQLNDSSILNELITLNSPCPSVGLKQIKLESGNYSSLLTHENKNIAGIKFNKHGFCSGENHGHAVYQTYKDCLADYVRIQNMMLAALEKGGYAEDSNYVKKLKK